MRTREEGNAAAAVNREEGREREIYIRKIAGEA